MEKKTYKIEVWEHVAVFRNIVAESEEEALQIMQNLVENGYVNLQKEGISGEQKYEVIGEVK